MEEHYKILDWLLQNNRTDVELRYNTNFTVTAFRGKSIFDYWNKFRKVEVGASLDAYGSQAEYIRKETVWVKIEEARKMMIEKCPQTVFYVSVTLSALSFSKMPEFHRQWVEQGLITVDDWNINPLTYPLHYRVHVLPESYRQEVSRKYADHMEWIKKRAPHSKLALERWGSALRFIQGPQLVEELGNFKNVTKQVDNLRGEQFQETFPEMAFIFNE